MITTMFFVLGTFLDRAPRIIIHLARNAEKGGGVLMSITVPNLKHSFIFPVPVPVPVPDFLVFHTPEDTFTRRLLFLWRCVSWDRYAKNNKRLFR